MKVRDIAIEDQTPVYGMPPLPFTATIVDEGSGIDESKIVFKLDGEVVPHQFLARTGELVYKTPITQPIRPLADGAHTISITVADWMGNILTREWVFRWITAGFQCRRRRTALRQNQTPSTGESAASGSPEGRSSSRLHRTPRWSRAITRLLAPVCGA